MISFLAAFLAPLAPGAALSVPAAPAPAQARRPAFASDRIGITVVGEGPDVVLIPGLSSSPDVWRSTVEAMPGYRYHLVHVGGFSGRAPGANAQGPVVAPVAEEIARYIRETRLRQPAVVGHSLGGAWAMMIAARHPALVSRLMVIDMLPFMGAMFGGPGATPESVRPMAEQIRQGIIASTRSQREDRTRQVIATMVRAEALRPAAIKHTMDSDQAVSAQAMYDLITTNLQPDLKNIRAPITVLWVRAPDAPVTEEQMAGFYKGAYANAPHASIKRVPNAYHFIMWDEPDAFRRELRAFLNPR